MPGPKKSDALNTLRQTRVAADKTARTVGKRKLMKVLGRAQRDLNRRLREVEGLQGPGKDTFSSAQLRITLGQVEDVMAQLNRGVRGVVTDQASIAADKSARGLLQYMQKGENRFGAGRALPLEKIAVLDSAVAGSEASVLRRLATKGKDKLNVLQRYGVNTIASFETELQQAMVQGTPWAEVRGNLVAQAPFLQGQPMSWAERIVRTETMAAYNRAGTESIRAANKVLGDMVRILSATFDGRTGWDSYQVHGQIRRPDEPFEWNGAQYMDPPNRPNDREVVVPHRVAWPIPAQLLPVSDGEVAQAWANDGRKGAPPPRPPMTTVPLEQFGKA